MRVRWFKGILFWAVIAGVLVIGLTIYVLHVLDRQIIEQTGAEELQTAFLRDASSVARIISKSGDFHDKNALKEVFQDIIKLSPGIRHLSVFELSPDSSPRIVYSNDPVAASTRLSDYERHEIEAGRLVSRFDREGSDHGWVFASPLLVDGEVVGALRGRFSLWDYEKLIHREGELAESMGVGAVIITSLMFFGLIRIKIHQPIRELLEAMRRAESGQLLSKAPLRGPADIQEVAHQFNQMLDRIRKAVADKEQLLGEAEDFNETLANTVAETKEELHRANLLLVDARIQAERASKLAALGELSAVVAHELGNPLNAMSGHLQLLQRELAPQEPNRHLTIIRAEITRMTSIIQHLLDSTRTEIRSVPVDLNAVIQDVHHLIAPTLSGQGIVLTTHLTPSLPLIAGDHYALRGVIFNLVINAIQALPNGGEVEIITNPSSEDNVGNRGFFQGTRLKEGAVRLTVRDSGRGIAPESLPRIFDPFFTTRQHEGGTGLGLAVCKRVVVSLGGRIGVESIIGQGSRFIVDLPLWDGRRADGRSAHGN